MSKGKVAVVVDSSRIWQVLRFTCRKQVEESFSSPLEWVLEEASKRGWDLYATETNLRRAKEDYRKELSGKELSGIDENIKELLLNIAEEKLCQMVKVVNENEIPYTVSLPDAVRILEDWEEEPEDSHALALAMYLQQKYDFIILWAGDSDFFRKKQEIEKLGIKLQKALIDDKQ
jgi:hypothetical protein